MRTLLICYTYCSTNQDHMFSTVKDVPERENPSNIQPPLPLISNKPTPPFECASSDVVIKIEESETQSLLHNGGPDTAYYPSNNVFGYAPKPQLQARDITEPQVSYLLYHVSINFPILSNLFNDGIFHNIGCELYCLIDLRCGPKQQYSTSIPWSPT